MKIISLFAVVFAILVQPANSKTLVVGAPFAEYPALAAQILDGANAAIHGDWTIISIDAACNDAKAAEALNLPVEIKPDAIIGFPCLESLDVALRKFGPQNIPLVTVASRAQQPSKLANEFGWPLFRVGPREGEDNDAVASLILAAWQRKRFAIVNDGAVFSQDAALAIKNKADSIGVTPVFFESFQPQLESQKALITKIMESGVTHVFIASDRSNIAQIARELGPDIAVAGAENLLATDLDLPLPAGVLMAARDIVLNVTASKKITATRQTPFAWVEGYAADAYVATEIAMSLSENPAEKQFETASGSLAIEGDGFISPSPFALFRFDGAGFQKVTE